MACPQENLVEPHPSDARKTRETPFSVLFCILNRYIEHTKLGGCLVRTGSRIYAMATFGAGQSILIFKELSCIPTLLYHFLVSLRHLLQGAFAKEIAFQCTGSSNHHLIRFFQSSSK